MNETLNIETEDTYEAPMLMEAGDFTDLTQGSSYLDPERSGYGDYGR
jgi:hypothetical protein